MACFGVGNPESEVVFSRYAPIDRVFCFETLFADLAVADRHLYDTQPKHSSYSTQEQHDVSRTCAVTMTAALHSALQFREHKSEVWTYCR